MTAQLVDEIDRYEASDLPRRRPNTMNKSGLIVNEIGMVRVKELWCEMRLRVVHSLVVAEMWFA